MESYDQYRNLVRLVRDVARLTETRADELLAGARGAPPEKLTDQAGALIGELNALMQSAFGALVSNYETLEKEIERLQE